MKMNNIYEIDKNGRISKLVMTATDEQFEDFKKGRERAKIYYAEHKKYIKSLTGFDFCVISYEPKIIFVVLKKDADKWTEIAVYNTKGAANKRINNELRLHYNTCMKLVSRYQTITEVL